MIAYDLHPLALLDLDEIWEFIREDNLAAADKVIADILASIDALTTFPNQGHKRPDLRRALWVVAVMHGRRSPRLMAAILKGRE